MKTNAEIVMMPTAWLEHHPDNPRKDLGDLRELTASIRESGVMQNLTAVPRTDGKNGYWVVIGNRRLEASRAAGVQLLPCMISDMDHRTQLATMMAENMQRVDLTLLEQAQGVQQMMDLGMEIDEIAKKTGLRKDAVKRRTVISRYDPLMAGAAIERGGSLMDFLELEKVEDESARKKLLSQMGTENFRRNLQWELERQKEARVRALLKEKLDLWATRIERYGYVGAKEVPMTHVQSWWSVTDKIVAEMEPPEDIQDVRYYWLDNGPNGTLQLLREKIECTPEDAEAAERSRKREWYEKRKAMAEHTHRVLRAMRFNFLYASPELRYDEKAIMRTYVILTALNLGGSTWDEHTEAGFEDLTGIKVKHKGYSTVLDEDDLDVKGTIKPALALLWAKLDRANAEPWRMCWQDNRPACEHVGSRNLRLLYELLTECGYAMTDEERRYMDGTHEIYAKMEEST